MQTNCISRVALSGNANDRLNKLDLRYTRKRWKRDSGYHRRSIAETILFRFKPFLLPISRMAEAIRDRNAGFIEAIADP